jgi:2-iminoacetate synthase ThiH
VHVEITKRIRKARKPMVDTLSQAKNYHPDFLRRRLLGIAQILQRHPEAGMNATMKRRANITKDLTTKCPSDCSFCRQSV